MKRGSEPVVTIIVPNFNGEAFLQRCLFSLQNQTFQQFEVVIVDDGSTDGSRKIAESFVRKDSRFRMVIQEENAGAAAARNRGLREAHGELIQFADADDEVHPSFLAEMTRLVADSDCAICGYHRLSQSGREIERFQAAPKMISSSNDWESAFGQLYRYYLLSSVCNKLYRRHIIEEASLQFDPTFPIGEDLLFNFAYLSRCRQVAVTDQILYSYYHTGGNSLTAARLGKKPEIDRQLCRSALDFCGQVGIAPAPEIFVIYLKSCFTSIEKMIFPRYILKKKDVFQEIDIILNAEATRFALTVSFVENREAHLYQILLRTGNRNMLLACAWVRGGIKVLLQRGPLLKDIFHIYNNQE